MDYRRFGQTFVVRIDRGEEIIDQLTLLCQREHITLGSVTGLGATDRASIGLFYPEEKQYRQIELTGPMEITSLIGNISTKEGETYLHLHINLCNQQMQVLGGHLNACHISGTCELVIQNLDGTVERVKDPNIGLNLYRF